MNPSSRILGRLYGSLLYGSLIGDALGLPVEFERNALLNLNLS